MTLKERPRKKIVIVSATELEIRPILTFLQSSYGTDQPYQFDLHDRIIHVLVTGVGSVQMAVNTSVYYLAQKPDLALLAGIGGAYNNDYRIGEAYLIVSEQFGDLGVEDSNNDIKSVFEIQLLSPDQFPFTGGKLLMQSIPEKAFLKHANGLTVNMVSGSDLTIRRLKVKFDADIESMEGAAFFYSSLICKVPFLQIRAVSNYVEPRDKEKWETGKAITQLNQVIQEMLFHL